MSTHIGLAQPDDLFSRVALIIEQAQSSVVRTVNVEMVKAYWLIGREIIEEEQAGGSRAEYGERLIVELSKRLTARYGSGFSATNLKYCRQFYLTYRDRVLRIGHAPGDESSHDTKSHAVRGQFSPNLSWTHYRRLMRVESEHARSFYEIEAIRSRWSSRELERQINSLLFERLAQSRDRQGVMELATKGQQIATSTDIIKDPYVLEFLGLPESHRLVESDLEAALVTHLRDFLLELGRGFAFVARQHRLTLDGDHFYVDLVFYQIPLKCYVLIDLKVGKLHHADLGQMQLYVNYYDRDIRSDTDNPTIGLILCTDKNDAVVRYTLGEGNEQIFASRYKLYLPDEAELAAEIRREVEMLTEGKEN
jgi:predicted nuclease of restriction endonuclease-like (RecB) superfamily